jgi:seryl-tRNA synthetase
MNKKEILELNLILIGLKKLGSTKFKYLVIRNIEIIKSYVTHLTGLDKENKLLLKEFEEERNELISKIGRKEENKVFIDVNDEEMFKTFNEELNKIAERHKNSLDKFEEQFLILKSILEEEVEEIEFKKIPIEEFPEEGISSEHIEFLNKYNIIN